MTLVLFASFLGFLVLGVPIAFALFLSGSLALWHGEIPLVAVLQRGVTAVDSFILLAVPFFILAGNLMGQGGISQQLINFAGASIGFIRGGLAHVNVLTSMLFAGITGAAVADTSAVGSILIPAMIKEGYRRDFSVAVTACSSVIGVIIPPSIPFVIYGVIANVSIGKLFVAGLIPGALIGLVEMIISYVHAVKHNEGPPRAFSLAGLGRATKQSILALMTPVIILGGILGGIVTPTEAAIVATIYALVVGIFVNRAISIPDLKKIFIDSAMMTAVVMFMVAGAFLYSWIITNDNLPHKVAAFIGSFTSSPTVVVLMAIFVYLIAGMFIDLGAAIILLVPVMLPVVRAFNIDPLFFGIITVTSLAIGLVTPPVGACLFIACQIAKSPIMEAAMACIPFLIGILLVILAIVAFPGLVTILPNYLM